MFSDLKTCCSHCLGFFIALMSGFFSAMNGLTFVFVEPYGFNAVLCNFYRFALMSALTLCLVLIKGETLFVKSPLLWLGSVFFSSKSLLFYLAITYSELYADVYAINTLQVAFVATLGWLILGERCDLMDLFLIALIIVGAVIVIQPEFIRMIIDPNDTADGCDNPPAAKPTNASLLDQYNPVDYNTINTSRNASQELRSAPLKSNPISTTTNTSNGLQQPYPLEMNVNTNALHEIKQTFLIDFNLTANTTTVSTPTKSKVLRCNRLISGLLAVISTACMSGFYVCLRKTKDLYLGTVVFYKNIVGVFMSVIIASSMNMWTFPSEGLPWIILLSICITGGLSFGLSVIALRRENAAVVSIGRTSQVIFSYLMEITLLKKLPNIPSSVGASFNVIASMIFFLRRLQRETGENCKESENTEHIPFLNSVTVEKKSDHAPVLNGAYTEEKNEPSSSQNVVSIEEKSVK